MRWRAIAPPAIALALLVALALAGRACVPVAEHQLSPAASEPADPPGTTARAGRLYLPRPGKYVLGYQASGPARLTVDGRDLRGAPRPGAHGVFTDSVVLASNEAQLRFAAPAGARLLWHPPGRRGAPEYVPAGNLLPLADGQGESPRWDPHGVGRSVTAAVIATLMIVVVVGLAGFYLRGPWRRAEPRARRGALAIFAVALVVRLVGLGDAGQTWDEDENWSAGRNLAANVAIADFSQDAWVWNLEHPPVMKLLVGVGALWADGFGPARAISAVLSALACAVVVLIGARLLGGRVGAMAGVLAALTPHLVAHGQVVGHEAPTVLWWSLGVWLALGVFDEPDPRAVRRRLAALGVVVGIAIASRFVNGLLAPLVGAVVLVQAPAAWRRRAVGWGLAIVPAVALATVVVLWPRLWSEPFAHLAESWAKLSKPHGTEPWLGDLTNQPGPAYFVAYLAATAPLGVLAAIAAYGVRVVVGIRRDVVGEGRTALVLALWLVVPLGVMASPVRQDGVRYVLPCLLAMSLAAAAGLDALATWARRRWVAPAIAATFTTYLAVALVRVHPYYLNFYGEHVGGPAGVQARRWLETAWWGEGLDRAVAYVNQHAAPGAPVHRGCVEPAHLTWFRGDLWTPMVDRAADAEWIVTYAPRTRRCAIPTAATRVFAVDVAGAVLAEVWHRPR